MTQLFNPIIPVTNTAIDPIEIRNQLNSLATMHSGATEPSGASDGWIWADGTALALKVRFGGSWEYIVANQPHSALAALGLDDHTLYLRCDGARALEGDLAVLEGKRIDKLDISQLVEGGTQLRSLLLGGNFRGFYDTLLDEPPSWTKVGTCTLGLTVDSVTGDEVLEIDPVTALAGISQLVLYVHPGTYLLNLQSKVQSGNALEAEIIMGTVSTAGTFADLNLTYHSLTITNLAVNTMEVRLRAAAGGIPVYVASVMVHEGDLAPSLPASERGERELLCYQYRDLAAEEYDLECIRELFGRGQVTFTGEAYRDFDFTFMDGYKMALVMHAQICGPQDRALTTDIMSLLTTGSIIRVRTCDEAGYGSVDFPEDVCLYWRALGVD